MSTEVQQQESVAFYEKQAPYLLVVAALLAVTYIPLVFPLQLIRVLPYVGVMLFAYKRASVLCPKRALLLVGLHFFAMLFDTLPVIAAIPFIPSILNLVALILNTKQEA